jgi:hypothetical protein
LAIRSRGEAGQHDQSLGTAGGLARRTTANSTMIEQSSRGASSRQLSKHPPTKELVERAKSASNSVPKCLAGHGDTSRRSVSNLSLLETDRPSRPDIRGVQVACHICIRITSTDAPRAADHAVAISSLESQHKQHQHCQSREIRPREFRGSSLLPKGSLLDVLPALKAVPFVNTQLRMNNTIGFSKDAPSGEQVSCLTSQFSLNRALAWVPGSCFDLPT